MSLVKRHPLITFFVLMFVLSWWPWPLYAMGVPWAISPLLPGPLLAALIVIPLTQGWAGLRELGLRMIRWRVGWRWYAVALGIRWRSLRSPWRSSSRWARPSRHWQPCPP